MNFLITNLRTLTSDPPLVKLLKDHFSVLTLDFPVFYQETVTGSTLNGRKDYLNAEEADKEKWDFLNFSQAWTPSDSITGDAEDLKDGVLFSHVSLNGSLRTDKTPSQVPTMHCNESGDAKNKNNLNYLFLIFCISKCLLQPCSVHYSFQQRNLYI